MSDTDATPKKKLDPLVICAVVAGVAFAIGVPVVIILNVLIPAGVFN